MKLNDLMPNEGKIKLPKRKGHGNSAGQGKTAGRGTKGQGSRAGSGGHLYRQGGNLPFFRRLPFIRGEGFTPPNQVEYNEINLDQLARFQAGSVVSQATLADAKLLHQPKNPVAILGRGDVNVALTVQVARVSKSAQAKIEAAGGKIELIA
ncbi:MAG: 50S ribosomal protein L15 [Anaerolineae bacterium]|jgi:large subunit ribosomal protein L15|nr:50S ribosomal protein L15 [Anaerolineae bacterium]MDO9122044.1 50S ribosomal protein L15 [Anaerolineaceae bacterium]